MLFSVLSLFSSGLLPAGFDRESESHPRSPIPRLTNHPAHYTHLSTPSSSNVPSLFAGLGTSSPFLLSKPASPLFSVLFLHSALGWYSTKLGKSPTSWLWLVTDRLPRKTSGCGPREIALMFSSYLWSMLFFFLNCHLVTLQAFLNKHTLVPMKKNMTSFQIMKMKEWKCIFKTLCKIICKI